MRHWSLDLHCFKFLTRREERPSLPAATDSSSINTTNSILGISGVFHLHESKAWWSSGHPNVSNGAILGECVLEIIPEEFHHDLEMSTISLYFTYWHHLSDPQCRSCNWHPSCGEPCSPVLFWKCSVCEEELVARQVFKLEQFCQLNISEQTHSNTPSLGPRLE